VVGKHLNFTNRTTIMELEQHYIFINGWLRATVLGANDGIPSTTSLVIGVAAASHTSDPIILAAIWGTFAMAISGLVGYIFGVKTP